MSSVVVMVFFCRASSLFSSALSRSRRPCSCLSVAAFFSQVALSSMGNMPVYWPGLWIDRVTTVRGRDVHAVGQRQMAEHDGAAADGAMRADDRAAGDADATRHGRMPADAHVVADLDQVVELDAVLDHRVVERAAVDAGVGADLHVVADAHGTELLDLDPGALDAARSRSRRHRSPRPDAAGSARRRRSPR